MTPQKVARLVERVPRDIPVEVPGGITVKNTGEYCETGMDRLSEGTLPHPFQSPDISLELIQHGR